ncbi:titin-like [Lucilia cuprina]|uniref:titin-like n=1 Tax=Lucilia cuprina TaxID=7375 RepID=UPI001F067F2B|nr:titin-like [Lucilia cuprina]
MRVFVVFFAVVAAASAASIAVEYLPPVADNSLPSQEYIPPVETIEEAATLADDGYRYKTVRKLKLRSRRDVSELPSSEYLPPPVEAQPEVAVEPVPEVISIEAPEEKTELAEDGYRYKTVRRLKYRKRRDVNELPANEYLPPTEAAQEEAVVAEPVEEAVPEEKTELAEDGYRYKTVRRLKYRHRRDVNELPSSQYLPPTEVVQEEVPVNEPVVEEVAVVESVPEEKTELAEDGYRYKTVRRLKYRKRRDVNELPASQYLPPTEVAQEEVVVAEPVVEEVGAVEAAPEEKTELAEDGYRYKTVRRLKYRKRRDVNELPASQYLPSTEVAQEEVVVAEPVVEEVAIVEATPEVKTELAKDGYRYKTVRRLKYRHRRDVNELPASQYLPPTKVAQEEVVVAEPIVEEVAAVEAAPEEKTELAEDGYRYKTVRRLKYRHRRDVNELPASQYLPPTEVSQEEVVVSEPVVEEVAAVEAAPEEKTELAEDGYRYKTVRRLKYRHRRDVNELPASQYLPPTEVAQEEVVVAEPVVEEVAVVEATPEEKTELAEDGYRYKTVRRLKYRQRRDVNELPASQYLPPTEVSQEEVIVSEPVVEEVAAVEAAPEGKTELAEDGYRYKTVRRLKYRHRRDVNELPASQYLPPTEVAQEEVVVAEPVVEEVAAVEAAPEEKTELAEDGYRYKTVRRLKYRHRRNVNELPANEYLPPTEVAQEIVAEPVVEEVTAVEAAPEDKTELAEDGYRYKTVRRLKYRYRN